MWANGDALLGEELWSANDDLTTVDACPYTQSRQYRKLFWIRNGHLTRNGCLHNGSSPWMFTQFLCNCGPAVQFGLSDLPQGLGCGGVWPAKDVRCPPVKKHG